MRKSIQIGEKTVGPGQPCYIVAEIGINHNGSLEIAKKLIDAAVECGCDAVKFQKRTVDVVYTAEELARRRENPFGQTNGDLKRGLEFSWEQYTEIDRYCSAKGIAWFASCWDEESVDFIDRFSPPCYKIASACVTDLNLLRHHRQQGRTVILSTGMSTISQIRAAVEVLDGDNLVILHCTSTYPSKLEELNLAVLNTFQQLFDVPIGYSGHEVGLATSVAAVVLGACMIERHISLDRSMWGTDQAASIEPQGFTRLVRDIRAIEAAMGDGKKIVYESEKPIIAKLRRVAGAA